MAQPPKLPLNAYADDLRRAFEEFSAAVQPLLVSRPDQRLLDQFVEFREKVYRVITDPAFLNELSITARAVAAPGGNDFPSRGEALLEALTAEFKGLARAIEVTNSATPRAENPKRWRRAVDWLLPRGSVAVKSLKELADEFAKSQPYLKLGLGAFGELLDFFKK